MDDHFSSVQSTEIVLCVNPRVINQKLEREKSELEEKEKGESISNKQLIDDLQTQLVQLQFELKAITTSVQTKYDDELQQRKEKLVIG